MTQLYTAPTAIRMFMKWGDRGAGRSTTCRSLRVLGTVGEPINPEAWMWYHTHIGGERCPIVDTWWQTETGGHMITPLPGRHHHQAGLGHLPAARASRSRWSTTTASPSSRAAATSRSPSRGRRCCGASGATPSATATPTGARFEGRYFAGDGAKIDDDGYLWLLGRVDDVMNVSGHRISTTEVESALVDHPAVAEAAVVGANDPLTGQAIIGYVILRGERASRRPSWSRRSASTWPPRSARRPDPRRVIVVPDLPKTRSGKIMRRLLRDVAEGRDLGDTTTLADAGVVEEIRAQAAEASPQED